MNAKTFRTMSKRGTVLFVFWLIMAMNANILICEAGSSLTPIQVSSGTEVGGIIEEDTIWMLEDSPYLLVDYVTVEKNVTLTIEPGVIVNIDLWGFMVEGELHAVGNESHRIIFESYVKPLSDKSWGLWFAENSSPWNETDKTGCIIEYSQIDFLRINYELIRGGYPKISNNILINHASSAAAIYSDGEISNNTITGGYCGILTRSGLVSYNVIKDTKVGIMCSLDSQAALKPVIVGNLIMNCTRAGIETYSSSPYIFNNTIFRNKIGFRIRYYTFNEGAIPIFIYNNFIDNDYNVFIEHEDPRIIYNMSYNWWGIKDISLIEEKIYDQKDNRRLCLINYIPFLNSSACAPLPPPTTPPPKHAEFTISNLSITPAEVDLGGEVTITFTVTNVGEEKGGYTITMNTTLEATSCVSGPPPGLIFQAIDGEFKQYRTIAGGQSETAEFIFTVEEEGTHQVYVDGLSDVFEVWGPPIPIKPAEFILSNFSYTSELQVGEPLRIYVDIANIGELPGEATIIIEIDGVIQSDLQSLFQLGPGEIWSQTWTTYEYYGTGTHTIQLDGFEDRFSVTPRPQGIPYTKYVAGLISAAVIYMLYRGGYLPLPKGTPKGEMK